MANNPVSSPYDGTYVRFDAVVATGKTTGWAFRSDSTVAYERTGTTSWKDVAFPGGTGTVEAAAATSPSSVWAAYDSSAGAQVDHWNGSRWTVVKSFSAVGITGITALGANDVWVFGGGGIWHDNGGRWTEVSSLDGGSALADNNVWGYGGDTIEHFNGRAWTAMSVASLLPPPPNPRPGQVTGVIALSPSNVYATAVTSYIPNLGGPLELLHYNGHSWAKVVTSTFGGHLGQQILPDGNGGLWLAAAASDGGQAAVLHYSGGRLTEVPTRRPRRCPCCPSPCPSSPAPGGCSSAASSTPQPTGPTRTRSSSSTANPRAGQPSSENIPTGIRSPERKRKRRND